MRTRIWAIPAAAVALILTAPLAPATAKPDVAFDANLGTGFNSNVLALSMLSDGSVLAGGVFSTLNSGNVHDYLVKLTPSGTLAPVFNTNLGSGFSSAVQAVAAQSDGKVVVGGAFDSLNGNAGVPNFLLRLNANKGEVTAFGCRRGAGDNG